MSLSGVTIIINGCRFNVVVKGSGDPVFLLHGFPDSAYLWRRQIEFLSARGYRVIAPDLHGFGDSEVLKGRKHYRVGTIARDVVSLMDHFGVDRAQVIGHDWGAVVGWMLAIFHHERVERFVALSVGHPSAYRSDMEQILRGWYAGWLQVPVLSEKSVRAFDWRLLRFLTGDHAETAHWIGDLSRKGRLTAGVNWYRANGLRMLVDCFPKAKVPVLGIWSSGDPFLTERQMRKSESRVDGPWHYRRIDGAGHWIPLDAPELLNGLLLEYLTGGLPQAGGPS